MTGSPQITQFLANKWIYYLGLKLFVRLLFQFVEEILDKNTLKVASRLRAIFAI